MEEELRSHIEHRADDLERSGLIAPRPNGARGSSSAAMSDTRRRCHEASGGNFFETLWQDVRFACACCASLPDLRWPPF